MSIVYTITPTNKPTNAGAMFLLSITTFKTVASFVKEDSLISAIGIILPLFQVTN